MPALVCALSASCARLPLVRAARRGARLSGRLRGGRGVASTIALAAVLYCGVLVSLGRRHRLARVLAPARRGDTAPIGYRAVSIALWAYVCSPSRRRRRRSSGLRWAGLAFGLGSWLVAVSALAAASFALALLGHSYRRVAACAPRGSLWPPRPGLGRHAVSSSARRGASRSPIPGAPRSSAPARWRRGV